MHETSIAGQPGFFESGRGHLPIASIRSLHARYGPPAARWWVVLDDGTTADISQLTHEELTESSCIVPAVPGTRTILYEGARLFAGKSVIAWRVVGLKHAYCEPICAGGAADNQYGIQHPDGRVEADGLFESLYEAQVDRLIG